MLTEQRRLAIVTGAASGLGRAFCRQLIALPGSWHIVAADVDEQGGRQTLAEIQNAGGATAEFVRLDVADAAAWLALRQRLQAAWPRLDLLVNNAGICISAEVGEGPLDPWRRVLEVNYLGVLNGCHAMTPWMKAAVTGSKAAMPVSAESASPRLPTIINVASIMALVPAPALGAYCASKAAVVALSEAMYAELRPRGVHVTVVAPGFFRTNLLARGVFATQAHRDRAEAFVRSSGIDAHGVARAALRGARRRQLYVVVGGRARWFWRWKRAAPVGLLRAIARRYARLMRNAAADGGG
jgi:NAD(P)-dependent dehydrogenase (short-subunit alcohol dehydrogenase family)